MHEMKNKILLLSAALIMLSAWRSQVRDQERVQAQIDKVDSQQAWASAEYERYRRELRVP
jgi:hypothetical protein